MFHNCYFTSIDLKDAYFFIPICQEDRRFLAFMWKENTYRFTCLPFGLNVGPRTYTKLLKPIMEYFRMKGITCSIYLDDLLLISKSKEQSLIELKMIMSTLKSLGFVINEKKSTLTPTKEIKYLGFIFSSENLTMSLPDDKRTKIHNLCMDICQRKTIKIRQFAEFIGVLISACPAVPYGILYTKIFEKYKYKALLDNSYDSFMTINDEIIKDCQWWMSQIFTSTSKIKRDAYDIEIYSDASGTGWGVYCNGQRSNGFWSADEKKKSINYLELKAAQYGLQIFAKEKDCCNILLRIDNTTAISYINRMGGVQLVEYNTLARDIWSFAEKRKIMLTASYIASADNVYADRESRRSSSTTELEINNEFYKLIKDNFYNPEIDLFANFQNTKCKRFASWHPDPLCWQVDSFTFSWKEMSFYAFPPFSMIARVLNKIRSEGSKGIVVVPYWPTQPWFPVFMSLLAKTPLYLGPANDLLLLHGRFYKVQEQLILVAGLLSGNL